MRILDTDVCVELLRGNERVIARRLETDDEVATTWVTASELFFGAAKSRDPDGNAALVTEFLASLPVLSPDLAASRFFGEVKAHLRARGTPLADADLFIAATALACTATLVTGNRGHYERIPGVAIEDWIRG